ncbi:MAG: RNA polymerase sigma factor [Anaerolineae bacterium]
MESGAERAALLQRARDGDGAAFDRLQRDLEPVMRRFLRRLLAASASEDDILQNAFLALYANLDRLEGGAHLLPFLYRVVRNLAYDELRRRGRYSEDEFDESDATSSGCLCPFTAPDEAAVWALIAADVNRAMLGLPEVQRQALMLYGQEGLSYEEVAEATGADVGTVKSRIYYGRRRLRQLLHPDTLEVLDPVPNHRGGTEDERDR